AALPRLRSARARCVFDLHGRAQIRRTHPGLPRFPRRQRATLEFLARIDTLAASDSRLYDSLPSNNFLCLFVTRANKTSKDMRGPHGWTARLRVVCVVAASHTLTRAVAPIAASSQISKRCSSLFPSGR